MLGKGSVEWLQVFHKKTLQIQTNPLIILLTECRRTTDRTFRDRHTAGWSSQTARARVTDRMTYEFTNGETRARPAAALPSSSADWTLHWQTSMHVVLSFQISPATRRRAKLLALIINIPSHPAANQTCLCDLSYVLKLNRPKAIRWPYDLDLWPCDCEFIY